MEADSRVVGLESRLYFNLTYYFVGFFSLMLQYSLNIRCKRRDVHIWTILIAESTPLLFVSVRCILKLDRNQQFGLQNTV